MIAHFGLMNYLPFLEETASCTERGIINNIIPFIIEIVTKFLHYHIPAFWCKRKRYSPEKVMSNRFFCSTPVFREECRTEKEAQEILFCSHSFQEDGL